jgi:oligosaccharide repeat unit polymerase
MRVRYWWFKPYSLVFFFILPAYLLLFLIGIDLEFTRDYLSLDYLLLGLLYLVTLGGAAYIGAGTGKGGPVTIPILSINRWYLDLIAGLTILAYVIWFFDVIFNPGLLLSVLLGQAANLRGEISTIPGLTTLTQLGVAYGIFYACYRWVFRQALPRRYTLYLVVIIILAVFRTLAWSERLGLIELVLPIALIYFSSLRVSGRTARVFLTLGPLAGLVGVIVIFGLAEYFRSWLNWAQYRSDNLLIFMIDRFHTYYATSVNNGAGLLTELPWPDLKAHYTFSWLYAFPGVGEALAEYVGARPVMDSFLDLFGDQEFTTFTGIFPVYYDFGILGGLVYAAVVGAVTGICYRQFNRGAGIGLLLYPFLYISLAEILRILYLGESRTFPVFIFLVIGYLLMRRPPAVEVSDG